MNSVQSPLNFFLAATSSEPVWISKKWHSVAMETSQALHTKNKHVKVWIKLHTPGKRVISFPIPLIDAGPLKTWPVTPQLLILICFRINCPARHNRQCILLANCDADEASSKFDTLDPTKNWSQSEQKLLEQALIQFPKSTQERWDKIAGCVPGKTKVRGCVCFFAALSASSGG